MEGFKTAIFEVLDEMNENEEWISMGASGTSSDNILRIWTKFNLVREDKKINLKMIVTTQEIADRNRRFSYTQMRFLEHIGTAPISISKDVVIIYNWEDLSIIKITNKNVAQNFREFFYSLWKISKNID